uniref:CHK domain-containing protein n=1 Tax=Angiostrongylus cantonensis TaxID=6313 RepID=A0A0K0DEU1_ANGCA
MVNEMGKHLMAEYPMLKRGLTLLHEKYTANELWYIEHLQHYHKNGMFASFYFIVNLWKATVNEFINYALSSSSKYTPLAYFSLFSCRIFSYYCKHIEDTIRTYVHGDLWAANILWRSDKLAGIVDWSLCHAGPLTEDLQRVLVTSCSVETRKRMTRTLLKYYFDTMQTKMAEIHKEMPFSFKDLEVSDDYHRTLPYTCGLTLFAVEFWSHTSIIRKGKPDDNARMNDLVSRLQSLLDDTVVAHKWQ